MPPAIEEQENFSDAEDLSPTSPQIKSESPDNNTLSLKKRDKKTPAIMTSVGTSVGASSTRYLDTIKLHPIVRQIPWREGQELSQADVDSRTRIQERGALLVVTRGDVQPRPCKHCAAGNGRFTECIALNAHYQGSCASCVFPSKAAKCSLRLQTSPDGEEAASEPEVSTSVPKKRKRRSTAKALENINGGRAGATARVPRLKSAHIEARLQAQLAEEDNDPIEYLNVAFKKHKNDHSVPSPILPPTRSPIVPPHLTAPYHGGNTNPYYSKPAPSRAQHESWAVRSSSQDGSRASGDLAPVQYTTSYPAPQPLVPPPQPVPSVLVRAPPSASRNESVSSVVPVIDTLPKAKQRHIYSVISGMQGGIDHLEKQLSSLKTLLGIPDDDDPLD